MKKIRNIIIILMLVTILLFTYQVTAHPPQGMTLEYNLDTDTLDVTIVHNSPAPTVHYINKVDIEKNDVLVLSQNYDSQPSTTSWTYSYNIEAEPGDILKVTAYCNIQGQITKSITVEDPAQDNPPVVQITNPTKGYFHFSGIRLLPASGIIGETLGFGGFRLKPVQVFTDDDKDDSKDLIVKIYIDEEELGTANYNSRTELHELKWTGPALGTFTLKATAEDSFGNTNSDEMEVWYFCFIP